MLIGALLLGLSVHATSPASASAYLALGDSYTIGEGVRPGERWPAQLAALLREAGVDVQDPQIVARTGWTTDELSAAMDAEPLQPVYGFVSLSIGVNNQYRERPVAQFRTEFRALLQRAMALAGGRPDRVLVLSIPDWGVTPFARAAGRDPGAVAHAIDAFNEVKREECRRLGVAFVDVTPLSREVGDDPDMLVDDALHPSGRQYQAWTQLALPVARRLLAD